MNQRSDARRNRATILAAAEEVFAAESPHAPLQRVADTAGVGRGTLYRHFADRTALAAAMYEARLERYDAYAREHEEDPEVLLDVLRLVASDQMAVPGLFRIVNAAGGTESDTPHVTALWERTVEIFTRPLRASIAAGVIREDVELTDLFLAISMLYGVANSPRTYPHDERVVERSLALLRRGMGA
ncbi:TetR/AcrR family transcriptional regulator [Janibacter sp. GXQ6167]|uniref:TetR/AcrR family transcriptional regulator n=1 Tax=Janibacter sp. GXQ6167 TaxID=3240791 RepID=UPI0035245C55